VSLRPPLEERLRLEVRLPAVSSPVGSQRTLSREWRRAEAAFPPATPSKGGHHSTRRHASFRPLTRYSLRRLFQEVLGVTAGGVIGDTLAVLVSVGVGGAVGGLIGAPVGMGIPEYEAKRYESRPTNGVVLLPSVVAGTPYQTRRYPPA
jgi:hypothetical protein